MPIGGLSVAVSLVKCIDFLVGFVVGTSSDSCQTPMGRRKPFVCGGGTLCAAMLVLLYHPPSSLIGGVDASGRRLSLINPNVTAVETNAAEAGSICGAVDSAASQCAAALQCVATSIAEGLLPEWTTAEARLLSEGSGEPPTAGGSVGMWLTFWFGLTYGFFFSGGMTIANIPYNAWAMEMTPNVTERTQVIGLKGSSGMLGKVLGLVGMLVLGIFQVGDMGKQERPAAAPCRHLRPSCCHPALATHLLAICIPARLDFVA